MANIEYWTDASKVIKNVWQLADCSSSGDGYSTFDGTAWHDLMTWGNIKGRGVFRTQANPYNNLDATVATALFSDVNARAACANKKRYLLAPNLGKRGEPWMWMDHTLAEGPPRSGYTLLSTNKQVWAIGGQLIDAGNNTVKTSVMKVDPYTSHIQGWEDGPDLPYAVNQTSAAAFGENGAVLFGGQSEMNPAPLMRLQNNTWSVLEAKGTPPAPRLYPCVATSAMSMFVYGGRLVNPTAQPDPLLHELNLESLTWTNHNLFTTNKDYHLPPTSISDISCHLPNANNPGPSTALADLHVFSQISTQEFTGPAMQVLNLNSMMWQPMYSVDTAGIPQSPGYASSTSTSTFLTIGIPVIIAILVLVCFTCCVYRNRTRAEVTPYNITTATSSSRVPPPIPECRPAYGADDIEMGDLARAIHESEIEAAANQTSLSPNIPAYAPPSYDDVISSIAALPDNQSVLPATHIPTSSDAPHNTVIVHHTSPSSIPSATPIYSSPS
ncbi:hypothetical protein DFS34DRAFT_681836 [Phlyctochytrium arcticum]|nr:hypothetical protein DFS34DRAFT_681836 [Phlyctochytrium arcticum]